MLQDMWLLPLGVIAGFINAVAGGGSLITFPALIGLGYAPITANITNSVGILPSNIGAAYGYRREIRTQGRRLIALGISALVGSAAGAMLLLLAGDKIFEAAVPWLIIGGSVLLLVQPKIANLVRSSTNQHNDHPIAIAMGVGAISIYGGYFGAAMGVMFLAVLGLTQRVSLQTLNAQKNFLAGAVNVSCVSVFLLSGRIAWDAALILGISTGTGGYVGSHIARRLPDRFLRWVIVLIGFIAAAYVAAQ